MLTAAGVSTITVSRVLRTPAKVRVETRQRVEAATSAYRTGVQAEERGEIDAAIDAFTDVQLFWPGYRDARDRLDALRKQRLEGGGS